MEKKDSSEKNVWKVSKFIPVYIVINKLLFLEFKKKKNERMILRINFPYYRNILLSQMQLRARCKRQIVCIQFCFIFLSLERKS